MKLLELVYFFSYKYIFLVVSYFPRKLAYNKYIIIFIIYKFQLTYQKKKIMSGILKVFRDRHHCQQIRSLTDITWCIYTYFYKLKGPKNYGLFANYYNFRIFSWKIKDCIIANSKLKYIWLFGLQSPLPSPSDYKHVTVVIEIERRVDKDRLLIGFS